MPAAATPSKPASAQAVRCLGKFQLLKLLCKTGATMQWLVADRTTHREFVLVVPRQQPQDAEHMAHWLNAARLAAQLEHPGLLAPAEWGEQEGWPFLAYDRAAGSLLLERLDSHGMPVAQLVPGVVRLLEGLASAHDAGLPHGDLHLGMVLVPDNGAPLRLIGLGAVLGGLDQGVGTALHRQACERDVLCAGLLLHHALVGRPALAEPDLMSAAQRMAPHGQEVVRLPFSDVQALAEPLRAIVNRATERQERQRYRSARTLVQALVGWLQAAEDKAGPLALLKDRLPLFGLLPAMPGGTQRMRRIQALEKQRLDQIATVVLEDLGMSLELLRAVNAANRRVGAAVDNGPILTVRRAIEMLGMDGLRRAGRALKAWPGALNAARAADLAQQMALARRAGQVAQWVRPAGYDGELVFLLAVLQRLGRLLVQYHFPDDAAQVRRLMQPLPSDRSGQADEPGMSERAASYAVLGVDLEDLGLALARYWGLDDEAIGMMRRVSADATVHLADSDAERLRQAASCGNEAVDAQQLPPARRAAALHQVAQRYGRALQLSFDELQRYAAGTAPEQEATTV